MSILRDTNWQWHYVTSQDYQAICNICGKNILPDSIPRLQMKKHLNEKHKENLEIETDITPFCTIQNGKVKCNKCSETYIYNYSIATSMVKHLNMHEVNLNKTEELKKWLSDYFSIVNAINKYQKCQKCHHEIEVNNIFDLINHVINAHQDIPPRFVPKM